MLVMPNNYQFFSIAALQNAALCLKLSVQLHHSFNQSHNRILKLVLLHHSHTTASTSHSHTETGAAAPQPPHCFNQSQSILKLVLLHHSVADSACFTYPGIPLFWMSLLHCFLLQNCFAATAIFMTVHCYRLHGMQNLMVQVLEAGYVCTQAFDQAVNTGQHASSCSA